jgi:serine/threonine-protein kinase
VARESSLEQLVGKVLAARYLICEPIGVGGMGTVFRAEHAKIGRKLAIKILHPRMLENEKCRRRFDREAALAARMRHRNVAGAIDVGITPEGLRYLVMEYAEGRSLRDLLKQPLAGPRVLHLAKQLCDGLYHAHEQGLIHRDFKPDNVIIERDADGEETPRILDFGVAIEIADLSPGERRRLTTDGTVLGTPHYMAPEHASGQPIDHRSDLFALGVICYEMLAGVMPFEGTGVEVSRAYLFREIPPMKQRAPDADVDPLLEAFTRTLLARSRDARPPTARAARLLLEQIERDRPEAARQLGVEGEPASAQRAPAKAPPGAGDRLATRPLGSQATRQTDAPTCALRIARHASERSARIALGSNGVEAAQAFEAPRIATSTQPAAASLADGLPWPQPPQATATPESLRVATVLDAPREPEALRMATQPAAHGAELRRSPSRWRAARPAVTFLCVGLCAIGALELHDGRAPATPAATLVTPAAMSELRIQPELLAAAALPAAVLPAAVLPAAAPPVTDAPAPPGAGDAQAPAPPAAAGTPRLSRRSAPGPTARAQAAVPGAAAARAAPTAAAVAELYGSIGRALKRLDDAGSRDATYDLWPRFRYIRIFDALRAAEARVQAYDELRYLEREIARRSR